jgi:hypothetical protein
MTPEPKLGTRDASTVPNARIRKRTLQRGTATLLPRPYNE